MARRARPMPPAVVLGGVLNASSCARTLRRYGVDVQMFPDLAVPDRWLESLEERAVAIRGAVVVPCSDHALEFLARHRGRLCERGYRPVPANDAAVMDMLDKSRTYELARRADVPVPATRAVGSLEDLRSAARDFSFPCALKPVFSHRFQRHFRVKAFVAESPAELERRYTAIMGTGVEMLLTEIVQGADDQYFSCYTYVEDDGSPLVVVTKRKLRQYPVNFGLGTYHMTTWDPEAAEMGLRFAEGAGLRGLVNVEFKRDSRDGRLMLIECNARLTAANELIRRAGVDFARIAYDRALGRSVVALDGFRENVFEWHPLADLRALRQYRARGELTTRAWVRSLLHPRLGFPAVDGAGVSSRLVDVVRAGPKVSRVTKPALIERGAAGTAVALAQRHAEEGR